jgi:UDP-N-acetylmuramyl pentapeptide phosphotransferase/UDP-N-acetylglucosamine-1-phosphate transferase
MWFENVLSIMSIALFIYWVYEMQNLIPGVLVFILAFLIMWPITALIKKYGIFNKLFNSEPNKKKGWRYAIGLTILLVIFVFSIFISSVLSPNVKKLINQIELKNPEVTPSTNYKLLN